MHGPGNRSVLSFCQDSQFHPLESLMFIEMVLCQICSVVWGELMLQSCFGQVSKNVWIKEMIRANVMLVRGTRRLLSLAIQGRRRLQRVFRGLRSQCLTRSFGDRKSWPDTNYHHNLLCLSILPLLSCIRFQLSLLLRTMSFSSFSNNDLTTAQIKLPTFLFPASLKIQHVFTSKHHRGALCCAGLDLGGC